MWTFDVSLLSEQTVEQTLDCMNYMDPDVLCPKKAVKLTHSLTHTLMHPHTHSLTHPIEW